MDNTAWFAGLFEGEGYFHIQKMNGTLYADTVAVGSTDLDVLEKIQSLYGGKIIVKYEANGNNKKCWLWYAKRSEALAIVESIYPYLLSRRKQRADEWLALRYAADKKALFKQQRNEEILLRYRNGEKQSSIAKDVNLTQAAVSMIIKKATT